MLASTPLEAEYWSGLAQGRLRLPRCGYCDAWQWPAPARCSECGHWGSTWHDVPILGTVFSWTRTWHRFGGLEGLQTPFVTVVAEIVGTDGIRLMGRLGQDTGEDGRLRIGAAIAGEIGSTPYGGEDIPVILWSLID